MTRPHAPTPGWQARETDTGHLYRYSRSGKWRRIPEPVGWILRHLPGNARRWNP